VRTQQLVARNPDCDRRITHLNRARRKPTFRRGYVCAKPVDAGAALAVYRACCGNAATMNPSDPGISWRNA
jgi:hypothetical protein